MSHKVLLIDVDSKIPNLALMKVSTWKKAQGCEVELVKFRDLKDQTADEVFASIVFRWNKSKAEKILARFPNADIGGSGYDLKKKLPDEVDLMFPDYSLYPECDYDLGFTSRGCCRQCYFCIVSKKEGKFAIAQHPEQFHDPTHKKVVFMDNNILTNKQWFAKVARWAIDNKLKVDFNQGLDIRLLDYDTAMILSKLRPIRCWKFAFDNMLYKEDVLRGIELLKLADISVRNNVLFYVYCDSDAQFDDALERCNILRNAGTLAFVMFNKDNERTQRVRDLARWCRPWVFFKHTFQEYDRTLSHVKERSNNANSEIQTE